jgi:hypothetical protein
MCIVQVDRETDQTTEPRGTTMMAKAKAKAADEVEVGERVKANVRAMVRAKAPTLYRERRGRVSELLRDLKATLEVHGEQAADDPTWGPAADLGRVVEDLEALLRFLRGGG